MITIKNLSKFEGKAGTIKARAADLVQGMESCPIEKIIGALDDLDRKEWEAKHGADSPGPKSASAKRWISQFAGFESKASGKGQQAIIDIISDGRRIGSRKEFYALLKSGGVA